MIAQYARQAALVIKVIPLIEREDVFALKGGTAINLFELDTASPIGCRDQTSLVKSKSPVNILCRKLIFVERMTD